MHLEIECATAEAAYEAIRNGDYPVISGGIYLSVSTSCRIICRGSRESSQPHVEASGHCQISARGRVKIKASAMDAVLAMGLLVEVDGGGFVNRVDIRTGQDWCEYYGVEVQDGCAVLFKGLDSEFRAQQQNFLYQPGETQCAPDWDPDPERECGGGLHFSPSPRHTLRFNAGAKKFVACLVPLDTILVHWDGSYPDKVRAPATTKCWEVDINGKAVPAEEVAAQ